MEERMKRRVPAAFITLTLLAWSILACNFPLLVKSEVQQKSPEVATSSSGIDVATNTVAGAISSTTMAPPPTSAARKIRWGKQMCMDCISDDFLVNFPIWKGVPPLTFWNETITITTDEQGNITDSTLYMDIMTNYNAKGEECTKGTYNYDSDSANATFDKEQNLVTITYQGTQSFSPLVAAVICGNTVSEPASLQFTFAVNEQGFYVLCLPGEVGEACLNHPMGMLSQ
jgi:hypothetical protein